LNQMVDDAALARAKQEGLSVAILGAGAGGLCMAIRLQQAGISNFTIYEKADRVGGTWRDNTYPGAGCDVPSMLYSYSFEPKLDWSRRFAAQPEIEEYFEHVARKYRLYPHIQFNSEVHAARFDEAHGIWRLEMKDGREVTANIVVSGVGQLNRPFTPDIPGLDQFEGIKFHSARWEHDKDLTGKTVAVIGNGASAIQFVPEIAKIVKDMTIFQRTPNWVVPKADRPYKEWEKKLFRSFPFIARLQRWLIWMTLERNFLAFTQGSFFGKLFEKASKKALEDAIQDPELRRKLTPDYPAGCKRILLSNDWFPALARPNVHVDDHGVERITRDGVVTRDGVERKVDAIVFATGFEATRFLAPMEITGRGGLDLNEAWANGAEAHRGVALAGFPNFFMLYGPNTNLGHNSIIFMIECQVNYITQCIEALKASHARYIDVKPEAMAEFNRELQEDMKSTVWAAGCSSWYKTADGRVTNNWSSFTARYWWEMRQPDFDEYSLVGANA